VDGRVSTNEDSDASVYSLMMSLLISCIMQGDCLWSEKSLVILGADPFFFLASSLHICFDGTELMKQVDSSQFNWHGSDVCRSRSFWRFLARDWFSDCDGFLDNKCVDFISSLFAVRSLARFFHVHTLFLVFVTFVEFMKDILNDVRNIFFG